MKTSASNTMSKMALAIFAVAALLVSLPAKGDIILSVESVTGAPGSTGMFDVLLQNTGTVSQNIAAFNFVLTTSNPDITFTDVTTDTTTATYIFPSSFLVRIFLHRQPAAKLSKPATWTQHLMGRMLRLVRPTG